MSVSVANIIAARGSLRFRLTALAAIAVAVVLCAGGMALAFTQRAQLTANLDASLDQRADAFASNFVANPPDGVTPTVVPTSNGEDRAMQLVGSDGTILAASPSLSEEALTNQPPADRIEIIETVSIPQIEDDAFRLLSRRIGLPDGPVILHVAQNIDDLNDTIRGLAISLAIAIPVAVVAMASLAWWLVGRTLQPVEAIRSEVAHISGSDLHRRVPVAGQRDEIAELAETMNQMLDRVETAHRKQQRFIADASHELRTPLTRLRTEVEVDLAQPGNADPDATNRTVLEEAIGLQRLLDDLLYLARSDENSIAQLHEPIDLDDLVLAEVTTARFESAPRIDTTAVSAAQVVGDRPQLRRLVRNLLSNAVRHAVNEVTIELSETDDDVVLALADDGAGVPGEALDRIFERFGRADDARSREHGGSGLGLAIARDIVIRHGGTIHCDTSLTSGARFVVRLPSGDRTSS